MSFSETSRFFHISDQYRENMETDMDMHIVNRKDPAQHTSQKTHFDLRFARQSHRSCSTHTFLMFRSATLLLLQLFLHFFLSCCTKRQCILIPFHLLSPVHARVPPSISFSKSTYASDKIISSSQASSLLDARRDYIYLAIRLLRCAYQLLLRYLQQLIYTFQKAQRQLVLLNISFQGPLVCRFRTCNLDAMVTTIVNKSRCYVYFA